ncbi:glycosylphosphatidylinositol anchor attachment 1 protein [Thecamonas trahens ATCC 50062]|uniref:Glycosylphosphatidylinositol anchor attachment 1 protein n=1 Tax=Thecamonas trahens ATCC 50062 TaxID=461836 RepID=A0A0L0DUZ7_THETB|nr:glycosylphosphatidylinositol anchor attachment 1 protein [Thecamonas trahens ATCC 50062]KNC56050.1 glycosylphosphatidylinositol anchor attachment 1 protein [Thecamonas trahens ATCC 50062]|eukprot:XP_013761094.1 glycosylphosphatidylinositol anchor attachment 1 protein [Thecamonas trahens ATCC 50062]
MGLASRRCLRAAIRATFASPLPALLALVVGLTWVALVPGLLNSTYVDENALLPNAGATTLSRGDVDRALASLRPTLALGPDAASPAHAALGSALATALATRLGVRFYSHGYALHAPRAADGSMWAGANVYGVYTPPRADGKEAIVITTALPLADWDAFLASTPSASLDDAAARPGGAVGLEALVVVAQAVQDARWMSRSLIVVLTDAPAWVADHRPQLALPPNLARSIGLQAWMDAYYAAGPAVDGHLRYDALHARAGALLAVLGIELPDTGVASWAMDVVGIDGLLPNMDLVNVVVQVANHRGSAVAYPSPRAELVPYLRALVHVAGMTSYHARILCNVFSFLAVQAASVPRAATGVVAAHAVPALSLVAVPKEVTGGSADLALLTTDITLAANTLLATLRSLSNLLESLHASFRLYVLGTERLFISYGDYVWPLACVVATALLAAIAAYLRVSAGIFAFSRSGGLRQLALSVLCVWTSVHAVPVLVLAFLPQLHHLAHALVPPLFASVAALAFAAGAVWLTALVALPAVVATLSPPSHLFWLSIKCIMLLEAVWVIVCGSLLNLGLSAVFALVLCLLYVPTGPFVPPSDAGPARTAISWLLNALQLVVMVTSSPPVVLAASLLL